MEEDKTDVPSSRFFHGTQKPLTVNAIDTNRLLAEGGTRLEMHSGNVSIVFSGASDKNRFISMFSDQLKPGVDKGLWDNLISECLGLETLSMTWENFRQIEFKPEVNVAGCFEEMPPGGIAALVSPKEGHGSDKTTGKGRSR